MPGTSHSIGSKLISTDEKNVGAFYFHSTVRLTHCLDLIGVGMILARYIVGGITYFGCTNTSTLLIAICAEAEVEPSVSVMISSLRP